jgi:hypothetical protein
MSPTPEHHDETPRFDPRSERFLESLRNLLEFEIQLCNTKEWVYRTETLFSTDIVEAADYAHRYIAKDEWVVIEVRRLIDNEPEFDIPFPDDYEEFMENMRRIFGDD